MSLQASAVDHATDALRAALRSGRYAPGHRLPPERDLAEMLRLSRPTLREAIRRLGETGLLESRRGSGTYVAAVDLEAVFAVRLRLEPWAAELAATCRDDADAEALERLLGRLEREIGEATAFAQRDIAIHGLVARASGNPLLVDVLERLAELTALSRALTSPERDAREATRERMRSLVHAIAERDAAGAAHAMTGHLEDVRTVARRAASAEGVELVLSTPTPGWRSSGRP